MEIVKLLHLNGGNIHQYDDECLRKSSRHGHINVVKYLIENGANIHSKHSQSLIKSIENGYIECADLLIKSGLKKNENLNITKHAIKHQQYNCLSLLIRYGYVLYDQHLRNLALSELHKNENGDNVNNHSNHNNHSPMYVDESQSEYETENSVSPTYSMSISPPLSPQYLSSSSSDSSMEGLFFEEDIHINNNNLNRNNNMSERLFLNAISEGLALRETMLVSSLTEYIIDEIAFIICSYEKLSLTFEDEDALNNINISNNKRSRYKRNC